MLKYFGENAGILWRECGKIVERLYKEFGESWQRVLIYCGHSVDTMLGECVWSVGILWRKWGGVWRGVCDIVECVLIECGESVGKVRRKCGGNMETLLRKCGDSVERLWKEFGNNVCRMCKECGDSF